jgi:hypothetical protein
MYKIPVIVENWVKSISKRDPNIQLSFYSNDSILIPTFDKICVGKNQIKEYFIDFLDKEDLKCEIVDNINQVYFDNVTISSGIYVFTFKENEKLNSVYARYSYVIRNSRIVNHHSSLIP